MYILVRKFCCFRELIRTFHVIFRLGSCWTPKQRLQMDGVATTDVVIVHGNSHPELANLVANRLGVKSGGASVYHKPNRESMVEIGDSVRGKDIYIIQTGTK